jgi:hypothetical protein
VCPGGLCDDRHQTTQKGAIKPSDDQQDDDEGINSKMRINEFQKKEHDFFMEHYSSFKKFDAKAFYRLQSGYAPHQEEDVLAEVEIVSLFIFVHFPQS